MALTKFASAQILEVKGSKTKIHTATLDKLSDYEDYRTGDGYLYTRVRAISSRVNKNHDGWPSEELAKAYRTFLGKPIFVDHNNTDPTKARGVVVDSVLHVEDDMNKASALDAYYATAPENHKPPTWVELLLEVDAKTYPKLAKAIIDGDIDSVSMGANVERSLCNICSNWASNPEDFCQHIRNKGAEYDHVDSSGHKTSRKSYEDCYDIGFFEISYVFDPADETAHVFEKRAANNSGPQLPAGGTAPMMGQEMSPADQGGTKCPTCGGAMMNGVCPTCSGGMGGGTYAVYKDGSVRYADDDVTCPDCGGPMNNGHCEKCESSHDSDERVDIGALRNHWKSSFVVHKDGTVHYAENPLPQSMLVTAPAPVDTLRQERVCPVCGSEMEDGTCAVCNYEAPPEGFDNPDLTKAQEIMEALQQQEEQMAPPMPGGPGGPPGAGGPPPPEAGGAPSGPPPGGAQMMGAVSPIATKIYSTGNVMSGTNVTTSSGNSLIIVSGVINTNEKPLLPASRATSDHPKDKKVLKDQTKLIQSSKNGNSMKDKTKVAPSYDQIVAEMVKRGLADSPKHASHILKTSGLDNIIGTITRLSADAITEPADHANTNLDQVGGDYDNPEAGTTHENLTKEVDIERIPTMTWNDGKGDSLGQQTPVTSEPGSSLGGPIGQPLSSIKQADLFPDDENFGKQIDVNKPLQPEFTVGPDTQTFKSDDFHITNPVTTDANGNQVGGPIGLPLSSAVRSEVRSHIFASLKLAEEMIELGLSPVEDKYLLAAQLEDESPEQLHARTETMSMVRKAGLNQRKSTTRVPPLGAGTRVASQSEPHTSSVNEDASLFM